MSDKNKTQKTDREKLIGQRVEQIRSISPALVNSDGLLDVSVLKEWLGEESLVQNNQGYYLNFAGKSLARLNADLPTDKELKVEKEQSKDFDTTQNVIIRGDNLDVLKILRSSYEGKVKIIYIDPPYNTNSANFVYNDSFREIEEGLIEKYDLPEDAINFFDNMFGTLNHSSWLFAMYSRLNLARDLLIDDGVMFISIDDNEQANLKVMCDEIFGKENNEMMIWHKVADDSGKMKQTYRFRREHEYILACYKNKQEVFFDKYLSDRNYKNEYSNPDDDYRGAYKQGIMSRTEEKSNPKSKNYYPITTPGGKVITRQWKFTEEKFKELDDDNRIYYGKEGNSVPSIKVFINEPKETTPISILDGFGTAKTAGSEIESLLGSRQIFLNPKPTNLIKHMVNISTKEGIILDFFAGSGTTAQAVMELNKEDGGNRKFILVQWDESIDPGKSKPAYDFCKENNMKPVISSICIERVNRAGEKIKQETSMLDEDPDLGYKVFSLTEKPKRITDENKQLQISGGRESALDTLYNMMAASGQTLLTDPIEMVEPNMLYRVGNAYYVLGEHKKDLKNTGMIFIDGYAEISLERWLNTIGIDEKNTKTLY